MNYKSLQNKLIRYRAIYNLSQSDIADLANIDVSKVVNFENGNFNKVSLEDFCFLLKALNYEHLIENLIPHQLISFGVPTPFELIRLGKNEEAEKMLQN